MKKPGRGTRDPGPGIGSELKFEVWRRNQDGNAVAQPFGRMNAECISVTVNDAAKCCSAFAGPGSRVPGPEAADLARVPVSHTNIPRRPA